MPRLIERRCKLAIFGQTSSVDAFNSEQSGSQATFIHGAAREAHQSQKKQLLPCILHIAGKDKGEKLGAHDLRI